MIVMSLFSACGPAAQPVPAPLVDLHEVAEVQVAEIPRTTINYTSPFAFSIDLVGTGIVQRVAIEYNVGTVTIGGVEYPAAVYEKQVTGVYNMYQTLIADQENWWVAWFYCVGEDLTGIYIEGTNGQPMSWEPIYNTKCEVEARETIADVSFPTPNLKVAVEATQYQIDAKDLGIGPDGRGTFTHLGKPYNVQVFETVECNTPDCGTQWHGLHAIISDEDVQCFGVFYAMDDPSRPLQLAYSRCLPGFQNPFGNIQFQGTWAKVP